MALHVIDEAKRCLQCKNAQCSVGCPVHTRFPEVVALLLSGNMVEAGRVLFENNPLSLICSLVCDHEKQCEGHCILGHKGSPVHVSTIEHYISDQFLDRFVPEIPVEKKERIAIIGSGPAGLTIAILLALRGYRITIFEAMENIGGVLRYGIPDFRLPKTILTRYRKKLWKMGIRIRPNVMIGPGSLTVDDIFRDGYKALFIGTGVWKPHALGIKGESLGHVHFAINYLKNPDVFDLGEQLIVIGAGNAAMDVARTALRKGVPYVTIFSRKGLENLACSKMEREYTEMDGAKFECFKQPLEITDDGVIFQDTAEYADANGKIQTRVLPGTEKLYPASSIIVAVSQGPRSYIVSTTKGIEINSKGLLVIDADGHTTREGVFASGDVVSGAKTVVEAVEYSKKVSDKIVEYVESLKKKDSGDCHE